MPRPAKQSRPAGPRDLVPGFAAAVRARRIELGLTGVELAERAGTHPQSVVMIENETRSPSLRMAVALAGALGLSLDQFVKQSR